MPKTAKQTRADSIPLCPFPKGMKAGIRCPNMIVAQMKNGRFKKICPDAECVYLEEEL